MSLVEGIWIVNDQGQDEFVSYDDLDEEVVKQALRPVGGFCYGAEDFKHLPLASTPFYIEGWLPRPGKMVVYGRGKVGKSFLALQMARCIGVGEDFLGVPTTQGRVLYLQFEIGTSVLQQRLQDTGKPYHNVFVGTSFAMKLDTKSGFEQLMKAVDAIKPNVILLDPFYKLFHGEEKESHDVMTIFDGLDMVVEAFDCSIVIFHHAGYDLGRGARGSSVFEDYPDAYIEVKKAGDKIRVTPKLLRHAELPPQPIDAVLDKFEFRVVDRPPTVKEKVVAYLHGHDGKASAEAMIKGEVGARRSVYDAISALAAAGVVDRPERGVVALTPQKKGT